jgi:hypothetical protein
MASFLERWSLVVYQPGAACEQQWAHHPTIGRRNGTVSRTGLASFCRQGKLRAC